MTVAVVTGGSTGIGAAICTHMLDAGYHVVSIARREPADPRCEHVEADLLDPVATAQAAQDIAARHAITHVVHNAGVIRAGTAAGRNDRRPDGPDATPPQHRADAGPGRAAGRCAPPASAASC